MKKCLIVIATLCLGLCLTACGNNSQSKEHASLEAENSSLKANSNRQQTKISNDEYALMAYLKLQGQSVQELKDNMDNMHWTQDGNTYHIDFGDHTTSMTVTKANVEVTYDKPQGDSMGHDNGHKTYSKRQLAEKFGNQKNMIEEILSSASHSQSSNNSSANNGQQTKVSKSSSSITSHSSSSSDHHEAESTDSDDDDYQVDTDDSDDSDEFDYDIPSANVTSSKPSANTAVASSANP